MPDSFPIPGGLVDLGRGDVAGDAYISGARATLRKPLTVRWPTELSGDGVPTVTTLAASGVTYAAATLNGTVNPQAHAASYHFEYGTTPTFGSTTPTHNLLSGTATIPVSAGIVVDASTTIYYRLVATNEVGTNTGATLTLTSDVLPGDPPVVVTGAATGVDQTTATLNGTVDPGELPTLAWFEYGATTGYGSTTPPQDVGSGASAVAVSAPISGLAVGGDIHFRLVAQNGLGTTQGLDASFTTGTPCGTPLAAPTVTPAAAPSSPPSDSVTVQADITAQGLATLVRVEYGPDTGYGTNTAWIDAGSGCNAVTVNVPLPPLSNASTYHYRFVAQNSQGTTNGADRNFTTLTAGGCTPAPPSVTGLSVTPTGTGTTATVTVTVGPNQVDTTLAINYGPTASYGLQKTQAAGAGCSTGPVTVTLTGLSPNTLYHVQAVASNGQGSASTTDQTFTTLTVCGTAAAAPTISLAAASSVASTSATLNPTINPKGLATSITVDWGLSTSYGNTVVLTAAGSGCTATAMPRSLTGLPANTQVFYRVTVASSAGNASATGSFTTLTVCETAAAAPTISGTLVVLEMDTSQVHLAGVSVNAHGADTTLAVEFGTIASGGFASSIPTVQLDPSSGSILASSGLACANLSVGGYIQPTDYTANTSYQARLRATNAQGSALSNTVTFVAPGAPTVTSAAASSVTASTATLNGTVNNNNVAGTLLWEWGLNSASGFTNNASVALGASASAQAVSKAVTGLTAGNTYKARLTFTRGDGGGSTVSTTITFNTTSSSSAMWLHVGVPSGFTRASLLDENGAHFYAHGTSVGVNSWSATDMSGVKSDLSYAIEAGFNFIRAVCYWKEIQPNKPTISGGVPTGGWSTANLQTIRDNCKLAKDAGLRVMIDMHYSGNTAGQSNTPNWLWNMSLVSGAGKSDDIAKNALFDNDFKGLNGEDIGGTGMSDSNGNPTFGTIPNTSEWVRPTCAAAAGGARLGAQWGPLTLWLNAVRKIMRTCHDASWSGDTYGVLDNVCVVDFMNEPPPGRIVPDPDATPPIVGEPKSAETARINNYRAFIETGIAWTAYDNPRVVSCYENNILQRNPIIAPGASHDPIYGAYGTTNPVAADWDTLPNQTTWPAGQGGAMLQVRGYINGDPAGAIHTATRSEFTKFAKAMKFDGGMAAHGPTGGVPHAFIIGEWTMLDTTRSNRNKQSQTLDTRGGTKYGDTDLTGSNKPPAPSVLGGRNNSWATPGNTSGDYWDDTSSATKAEGGVFDVMRAWPMHHCIWPFGNNVHHDDTVISADVAPAGGNSATITGVGSTTGARSKIKTKTSGGLNATTNNNNEPIKGYLTFLKTGVPYS